MKKKQSAMVLFRSFNPSMPQDKVVELCKSIITATGDAARAISLAKSDGWWCDDVAEPNNAMVVAGGRSLPDAIAIAMARGWWDENILIPVNHRKVFQIGMTKSQGSVFDKSPVISSMEALDVFASREALGERTPEAIETLTCGILKAKKNVAMAIVKAKSDGWWDDNTKIAELAVLETDDKAMFDAILLAKNNGWWDDSRLLPEHQQFVRRLGFVHTSPTTGGIRIQPTGANDFEAFLKNQMINSESSQQTVIPTIVRDEAMEWYNKTKTVPPTNFSYRYICERILGSTGNVTMAIASAVSDGWWDYGIAEPHDAILTSQGELFKAIAKAKNDGWWDESKIAPRNQLVMRHINKQIQLTEEEDIRRGICKPSTESREKPVEPIKHPMLDEMRYALFHCKSCGRIERNNHHHDVLAVRCHTCNNSMSRINLADTLMIVTERTYQISDNIVDILFQNRQRHPGGSIRW